MNIRRISAQDFLAERQKKEHILLDLRTHAENATEALEDSCCLPVQDLDAAGFNKLLEERGHKQGPVYLLCQTGKRADIALEKLRDIKDVELVVIEGGLNALKAGGCEVQKG